MNLYAELKRRNVFRVAAAYVVVGWLFLQVSDIVLGFVGAPAWVGKAIIALLVLGLVPSLAVAWIFEVGPAGLRLDEGQTPQTASTHARRLDYITLFALVVVALMVMAEHLRVPDAPQIAPLAVEQPAVAAAPAAEIPARSIAVLPFANRSAEADAAYFVDGVHDDLLTQLARNGELKVISRTSVMEYRDSKKNLRQIGRELGVASVLEGAVQRAGNRVRINAQLIDTATDKHLWAETYDRELTPENIFEIQTGIARAIAAALAQALGGTPAATASPTASAPTQDREAYDLYLQARALNYDATFTSKAFERGADLYRKAIARDPAFALAMGELGHQLTNIYWFGARDPALRDEARLWIDRALALAPGEPWLHWILADHLYHGHLDYDGALRELALAERGLPNGAQIFALRGYIQRRRGDLDAALRSLEAAVVLDPRSYSTIVEIIGTHVYRGDLPAVRLWSERLKAIPSASVESLAIPPRAELALVGDTAPSREFLAAHPGSGAFGTGLPMRIAYLERRYDDATAAIATFSQPLVVNVRRALLPELQLAFVLRAQGRSEEMRERAAAALAKLDAYLESHPDEPRATTARGMALAMLGRHVEARRAARSAAQLVSIQADALVLPFFLADELITLAMTATSEEVAAAMASYLALEVKYEYFDSIMLDPVFDSHREHPAMRELARKYSRKTAPP